MDRSIKIRLMQLYPDGHILPIIEHYNKKYRIGNGRKPLTFWHVKHALDGRPSSMLDYVTKCANDLCSL